MSGTFSSNWRLDIAVKPSRWPARLHLGALALALTGLFSSGLALPWQLGCVPAALWLGWLSWRYRLMPLRITLSPEHGRVTLDNGECWPLEAPYPAWLTPWTISFCRRARWRRRWVTLYPDQLRESDARALRVLVRLATGERR